MFYRELTVTHALLSVKLALTHLHNVILVNPILKGLFLPNSAYVMMGIMMIIQMLFVYSVTINVLNVQGQVVLTAQNVFKDLF